MILTTIQYILTVGALSVIGVSAGYKLGNIPARALFGGGALTGLVCFLFIPNALSLCSSVITIAAMILGIILAVFIEDAAKDHHFTHSFAIHTALTGGVMGGILLWGALPAALLSGIPYFIAVGLVMPKKTGILPVVLILLPVALLTGGLCFGALPTLTAKWQGLLIALVSGMTVHSVFTALFPLLCDDRRSPLPLSFGLAAGLTITLL